jgi:hypothetical protein
MVDQVVLANAKHAIHDTRLCLEDLFKETEQHRLHKAWSGLLDHYIKAVAAMVRASSETPAKGWGDLLKATQRDDPMLQYAFQARNASNHVFELPRRAVGPSVQVGGAYTIRGDSRVSFEGCVFITPEGDYHFVSEDIETQSGRLVESRVPHPSGSCPTAWCSWR